MFPEAGFRPGILVVCEICGKSIERLDYERHLRTHKEKRIEVCKICYKEFTNLSNFKYHMAHHGSERPWLCNECPKNYKTKIDLLQHQRVHDKARDPFQCETCGEYFRTRSTYNTHQKSHNFKGPQKCSICEKIFVNLRSHIQMVHQKIRQHICNVCSKAFGKKSGLDRHIITVHEKMRCWVCDLCEKSFGEKAQLFRHRKVHFKPTFLEPDSEQITEDQEVFEDNRVRMRCGICKRIVNSRAALKRHKILVHEKKRNLLCDFCPKLFGEKSNLKRHIMKSHATEASLVKVEPDEHEKNRKRLLESKENYACLTCDRIFVTNWGLQAHEENCLINQQKKLNKKQENEENDEEEFEDVDKMEEVFVVSSVIIESLDIKQEPPFMEDNGSNESFSKFIPEVLQVDSTDDVDIKEEPLDIDPKIEPEEEFLDAIIEDSEVTDIEPNIDHHIQNVAELSESEAETLKREDFLSDDENSKPAVTFLKRFTCKVCGSSFKEKRYFQSHYQTVHEKKKKTLKCNVEGCSEIFLYRAQRLRHLRTVHPEIYEESEQEEIEGENVNSSDECDLCNVRFVSKEELDLHIAEAHEDVICEPQSPNSNSVFSCDSCSKKFTSKRSLVVHVKNVHLNVAENSRNERTCDVCSKVFKKVKYMEIHKASVHNTEPQFFCPICNRGFSFQRSMERHVKAIHEDRKDYNCSAEGCEKAFRSKYELNEHFNNIHAEVKRKRPVEQVTCDICEKICSSRKVLYSHKKLVHEGVKWGLKFECKLCKEIFESKYKKSKHWGQVHRNGAIKMRTCHYCSSDFQLYDEFKQHVESHVGRSICLICGHDFADDSSLFLHLETHRKIEEELRQYICDVCSHRLSTKAQLVIHMRKHFTADYYMCDVCGKSYKFIAPFLHHKKGHENRFDFPCRYCEKKFRVARDRMLHERIHTKERPYKCDQCQKSFAYKANYLGHLKTHEARSHVCKHCGLQYTSSSKLRQHEDSEHPEERPFRCQFCRKSFKLGHSLEAHKYKCSQATEEDIDDHRISYASTVKAEIEYC